MKQQPTVKRPTLMPYSNDVTGVKEAPIHSHRAASKSTTHVTLFLRKLGTHLQLQGFISQKTTLLRCFGAKQQNYGGKTLVLTNSNVLF